LKRNSPRQMIQLSTEKPNLDETKVGNGAPKRKTRKTKQKFVFFVSENQSTNKKQEQKHH